MVEVLESGFYTTIQDGGRFGYRHLGVPISGAMDKKAFDLAQLLNGVKNCNSIIECTMIGPILLFHKPCSFVLTGAKMEAWLNNRVIENNTIIFASSGDKLKLRKALKGIRTYIKINKVLRIPSLLGSTSFFSPITQSSILRKNSTIQWNDDENDYTPKNAKLRWDSSYLTNPILEVSLGPEINLLPFVVRELLLDSKLTIKSHNRMGYRVSTPFEIKPAKMLSCAVQPGTVQMTPSGMLIIVGLDGQVSGGYPRVFQLTRTALNQLVQKKEGDTISFKLK